ncbi:U-box domain-containing protein 21-like [Amaranthus tricolor]|uniref:U-box domain-containing protein 21-like n=1 Tax=Amaranthus tricolor TaxID=29722 RepID=UPI002586B2F1|nr:U-box domain-containing protein 21-like [Amaranthus tricolor]
MISSWRRKRAGRGRVGGESGLHKKPTELIVPTHFRCPISLDMMKDPVTLSTGITYDRENIEKWIEAGNVTCPMTKSVLKTFEPIPNHTIRRMIQDWCVENRSHGIERIPTPRIPISSDEVGSILDKISTTRNPQECRNLVEKISKAIKESERNKKCIVGNGVGKTLALVFQSFADGEGEIVISLLEEIMVVLISITPLESQAEIRLSSPKSLERLVLFLKRGSLSSRRSAVLILKDLVSSHKDDQDKVVDALTTLDETIESLVKLVKEPICPSSTKASLVVIYHMITPYIISSNKGVIIGKFIEMGLVTLVLDILVDADKSMCEKALGVLDGLCRTDNGRLATYSHALAVPVVVKKILRVTDLATEFSVSILYRLCENEKRENGGVIVEALQVGAFQKLLLILQVGWNINERIKEKVTKLLKVLNLFRNKVECIESMDFKNLKRPF